MPETNRNLDRTRRDAGLSHEELWLRYFALGGMRSAFEIEAILYAALNERFSELGGDHPIPYTDDDAPETT